MSAFATRLATCFGVGRVPFAPGTAASFVALPFGCFFAYLGIRALIVAIVVVTAVGIWACGVHAKKIGVKDPSECVIDEVAGQWIALLPIAIEMRAFEWRPYVLAFFLFRLLDMTKPWPIGAFEKLDGGLGIMADDIVAGLLAGLALYGALAIQLI